MPGGLRSASLHSGPSPRFAAGPSPYTCPGVDKPPGTPYPSQGIRRPLFHVF